jgi:hypothetical protein
VTDSEVKKYLPLDKIIVFS